MNINIPGIDIVNAIKNSGSEELFTELLGDVYKLMDDKINRVESYLAQGNIQNYTVEVHALKTTCRMIGAMDLGEDFFALEKLGKEGNVAEIERLTPEILESFKALKPFLEPFAANTNPGKNSFDKNAISNILNALIKAVDDFDLAAAEEATKQLLSYDCNEELSANITALDKLVSNLDYDQAKEQALEILNSL